MRHIVRLSSLLFVLFVAILIGAPSAQAERQRGNDRRGGHGGARVERHGNSRQDHGREFRGRGRGNHGRPHQGWFNGRHSQFRFHYRNGWYAGYWNRVYRPICGRSYSVPTQRHWSSRLERWVYTDYVYVPFPCDDDDYYYED
jgi:hypothetical protein